MPQPSSATAPGTCWPTNVRSPRSADQATARAARWSGRTPRTCSRTAVNGSAVTGSAVTAVSATHRARHLAPRCSNDVHRRRVGDAGSTSSSTVTATPCATSRSTRSPSTSGAARSVTSTTRSVAAPTRPSDPTTERAHHRPTARHRVGRQLGDDRIDQAGTRHRRRAARRRETDHDPLGAGEVGHHGVPVAHLDPFDRRLEIERQPAVVGPSPVFGKIDRQPHGAGPEHHGAATAAGEVAPPRRLGHVRRRRVERGSGVSTDDQAVADLDRSARPEQDPIPRRPAVDEHRTPAGELREVQPAVGMRGDHRVVTLDRRIVDRQRTAGGTSDEVAAGCEPHQPAGIRPGDQLEHMRHTPMWTPNPRQRNARHRRHGVSQTNSVMRRDGFRGSGGGRCEASGEPGGERSATCCRHVLVSGSSRSSVLARPDRASAPPGVGPAAAPSGGPAAGRRLADRRGPAPRPRPGARRRGLRPRRCARTRPRCADSSTARRPTSSPPGWCSSGSCPVFSPSCAAAAGVVEQPFDELVGAAWIAITTFDPARSPRCLAAALISDADYRAFRAPRRRASAGRGTDRYRRRSSADRRTASTRRTSCASCSRSPPPPACRQPISTCCDGCSRRATPTRSQRTRRHAPDGAQPPGGDHRVGCAHARARCVNTGGRFSRNDRMPS